VIEYQTFRENKRKKASHNGVYLSSYNLRRTVKVDHAALVYTVQCDLCYGCMPFVLRHIFPFVTCAYFEYTKRRVLPRYDEWEELSFMKFTLEDGSEVYQARP
jgi:hypothetical protein